MSEMRKRIQLSPDVNRDNKRVRYTEDGIAVTTLSLSPLGKEVTAAQLFDYFSTFGPVDSIHITSVDYATNGSVKFTHTESAAQALDMKRHSFAGHTTYVTVSPNRHQEESIKDHLPVELTNVTGTCLVDLNEDCLSEMFGLKYLGLMDLLSVAETCKRLKEVAVGIFRREWSVITFDFYDKDVWSEMPEGYVMKESCIKLNDKKTVITIDEARRIFFNFGSVISELEIDSTRTFNEQTNQIIDLAVTYCSNSLKSLILGQCKFDESMGNRLVPLFIQLTKLYFSAVYIVGDCKDLFANCESLVELSIVESSGYSDDFQLWCLKFGDTTFPKLRNFKYDYEDYEGYAKYNWENFILRHKTLRTISLDVSDDCSSLLPVIAKNCGQIEKLKIKALGKEMSKDDYEKALRSLLVLDHLKVLKLDCNDRNVTKFMQELHLLKSLESLELMFVSDVSEFIPGLSQLKKLKVLRLSFCHGAKDLNLLGNLDQLTELKLHFDDDSSDQNLDIVAMVERLINLETLNVWHVNGFEMDIETYLRIVHVVQGRPDIAKRFLYIMCGRNFNLDDDDKNREIVEML